MALKMQQNLISFYMRRTKMFLHKNLRFSIGNRFYNVKNTMPSARKKS